MTGASAPATPSQTPTSWALTKRVWSLWITPRLGALGLATLLAIIVAAATSSYAVVITWVFRLIEDGDLARLAWAPLVIVAIVAVKSLFWFFQMWATQALTLRVIEDMQKAMFAKLLAADFARITAEAPGALAARFVSDVDRVREALTRAIANLARDAFIVVGSLAVMLYLDWVLALLVLIAYPIAFQPVNLLGQRLRRSSTAAQEQIGSLAAFLTESFTGDRIVKTYGLEDYQQGRGKARFAERFRIALSMARARSGVEPILEMFGGAAFAGVIALAVWRAGASGASVAELIGFFAALTTAAQSARAVGSLGAVAQEGFAAIARVFAVLDEEAQVRERPGATGLAVPQGRVTLEGVSFAYPDGATALDGVDLVAEPGVTTAIVGPSGGGKSTVLNLIARLYDPSQGAVRIDGADISTVTFDSLRAAIAVVSQDAILFEDTVKANVLYGRPDAGEHEVWAALEAAAARDFVETLPGGLEAPVGPGGSNLSGGQRQRIAIARAILKDAPILLLDEATSALDAQSEADVQAALERLARGRTTIVVAHRLSTVREASNIYVFKDGRVVEHGADADLARREDGVYAQLRRLQLTGGD